MESVSYDVVRMDFQSLISCIQWSEDSGDCQIIIETLKTITDICANESCGKDAFREEGGLDFLVEFMFKTDNTIFLEHSLKTLASVIDENIHSQMYMTKKSMFEVIQTILRNQTFPISVQKDAVILVSAILYQNSSAQSLISEIGLIQDLLNVYEHGGQMLLTNSSCVSSNVVNSLTDLWISVNSALCFSVNNPQNEKNQEICGSIFSKSLKIMEVSSNAVIISSISSFLSLSIANNGKSQDEFAECDGLLILKRFFQKYFDSAIADMKECNNIIGKETLQVINNLIGIISAAASDNEKNAALLGKLGVISLMVKLLFIEVFDISLKTRIVLALGHCIDASRSNKSYVLHTENFDTLLKKNLQIGNQELSSASKYLLQVCLTGSFENEEDFLDGSNFAEVDSVSVKHDRESKPEIWNQTSHLKNKVSKNSKERGCVKGPSSSSCSKLKYKSDLEFEFKSPKDSKSENKHRLLNKMKCNSTFSRQKTEKLIRESSCHLYPSIKSCSAKSTRYYKHINHSKVPNIHGDSYKTTDHYPSAHSLINKWSSKIPSKKLFDGFTRKDKQQSFNADFHESESNSDSSESPYYTSSVILKHLQSNKNGKEQNMALNFLVGSQFNFEDVSQNQTKNQCRPFGDVILKSQKENCLPSKLDIKTYSGAEKQILANQTDFVGQKVRSSQSSFKQRPKNVSKAPTNYLFSDNLKMEPYDHNSDFTLKLPRTLPEIQSTKINRSNSSLFTTIKEQQVDAEDLCSLKNSGKSCSLIRKRIILETQNVSTGETKRRKHSQALSTAHKINRSGHKFDETSDSSNYMQVIVFPSDACEEHNLISSFENLKVVLLEEVNK